MSILQQATNVTITGGTYVATGAGSTISINQGEPAAGADRAFQELSKAAAHTALHDSSARFDAPRCHRNTRASHLDQLEKWMLGRGEDFDGARLIWLQGGAGAGKSAIMQSTVERSVKNAVVLGSFFFSRSDPSRNNAEVVIPTLAYQLARAFPAAMATVEGVITHDPLIFKASLDTQAYQLLVRPMLHLIDMGVLGSMSTHRSVFVIDGLDECHNSRKQELLIRAIASILCEYEVPVSFLVSSRPELAIIQAFNQEKRLHGLFATIYLDDNDEAQADIRQFVEDAFRDIVDSHPMRDHISLPWPSTKSIDNLVWKSSGHFVYAATAMKFIAASDEHPSRALQVIEGLEPSRTSSPFAELDALYIHILSSAKYANRVLAILRQCFWTDFDISSSYSVAIIALVQDISPADVHLFLSDIQALVSVSFDGRTKVMTVRPRHLSLEDFFKDETRSQNLYIEPGVYYASLLSRFFHLLGNNSVEFIISSMRVHWTRAGKEILIDGDIMLVLAICRAIGNCCDSELVSALIRERSPADIWHFCFGNPNTPSFDELPCISESWTETVRSFSVAKYMTAIRDCIGNTDNALYLRQFQMYMQFLLDNLNSNTDNSFELPEDTNPPATVNRIIPALLFSSSPSILPSTHHLIFNFYEELGVNQCHACYLVHLVDSTPKPKIDQRTVDALSRIPQSKASWSTDLAAAMKVVLRLLHRQSWRPPFHYTNKHERWLKRTKPAKHFSMGSPRLSSCFYDYRRERGWSRPTTKYDYDLPYHYSFPAVSGPYPRNLCQKSARIMCDKGYDCILLLKAVIFFLHKADDRSEVAQLARKSLPVTTLWFPKLMKRARAQMDQYALRWEESLDGLLERTTLFSIDSLD